MPRPQRVSCLIRIVWLFYVVSRPWVRFGSENTRTCNFTALASILFLAFTLSAGDAYLPFFRILNDYTGIWEGRDTYYGSVTQCAVCEKLSISVLQVLLSFGVLTHCAGVFFLEMNRAFLSGCVWFGMGLGELF